jgi:hypothetical protein
MKGGELTVVGNFTVDGEWCDIDLVVVKNGDRYYPITPCCGATATGSEGATCCRSCYDEVDTVFGSVWDEDGWNQFVARIAK